MTRVVAACMAAVLLLAPARFARADSGLTAAENQVQACLMAASETHRVPPALIMILLKVEGGTLGRVTGNTNATVDIGPMQVNTIWVPVIAKHWRTTPDRAYTALRDNFCANLEGGAWILRQALDEARGDFWNGVGIYHSHNPVHKDAYLKKVLDWTIRLRDQSRRTMPRPDPGPTPVAAADPAPVSVQEASR